MLKKVTIAAAILAVAGVAFSVMAPGASAAEPTPVAPKPDVLLHGAGVLDAHGTGVAAVKGLMDYHATADAGLLLVKDINGDARVDVDGFGGTGEWRGFKVYFGIRGNVHVVGSDVAVIVVAHDIDLHAAGKGWAFLKGEGTFTANGRGPFPWTEDGVFGSVTL
jgi:hypothetical protein